ncbi:MAG: 30S ribosomal protein S12 methylthiotransferase RimO [Clostridia bacterium]|nr:30S ribosomal protein S12 methylthiotransferase RimO [Clostridia bacterium]
MCKDKKIGVISLGCDKNRVDTEKMLAILKRKHTLVANEEEAEIIIINTCAFLENSRKEAILEILRVAELKKQGLEKIIVTGCLPQKFIDEIFYELVEVDGFLGVSDYAKINRVINQVYLGKRVNAVGVISKDCGTKRVLTTTNYAYLKIADGCSNHCTYCLIPKIRGKFRSTPMQNLIAEAKGLGNVKELILVAQDVTRYGEDLLDGSSLITLIQNLSALKNVKKIRLLYCYPENITNELIEEIKTNEKVIKYLDIPLQHADDKVLKLMNRRGTYQSYLSLINKLKQEIPNIAIRSTFITGFPNEDETAFNNLLNFIKEAKLFNVGFFAYSREKDTPADKLDGHIENKVKQNRLKKLYSAQKKVVKERAKSLIGFSIEVLAEGFDEEGFIYYGRAYFNAPDIDGKIYFFSKKKVELGKYYKVKITGFTDYDFYGERL